MTLIPFLSLEMYFHQNFCSIDGDKSSFEGRINISAIKKQYDEFADFYPQFEIELFLLFLCGVIHYFLFKTSSIKFFCLRLRNYRFPQSCTKSLLLEVLIE